MIERVAMWANIDLEFDKNLTLKEIIKKYTLFYSGKDIDNEYYLVAQPLVLDPDLSKRVRGEIENFANMRPRVSAYDNSLNMNIIDYQTHIKEQFKEYSKDIGMDISVLREIHFIKLFHLSFLCLAGKKTDDEKYKDKINRTLYSLKSTLLK